MKNWYQTQITTIKNTAKNEGRVTKKEDKKRNNASCQIDLTKELVNGFSKFLIATV